MTYSEFPPHLLYLNAYVEIPNQDLTLVNISTVKLNGIPALNDTSYHFVAMPEILDRDTDGDPEIRIIFDRESIQSVLVKGENEVTVTGKVNDIFFVGTGVIAVYTTSTPSVGFIANTTSGNAPLTVSFTSTSTGYPDMWIWDFGDGEVSYIENPVHVYNTKGTYNVSLKVMNDNGLYSEEKVDYISVLTSITPNANFTAESSSVTKPIIMNFTDHSTNNPMKWYWDFGDDANSTEQNPSHVFPIAGNYTVMLWVKNSVGEDTTFRLLTIPEITNLPSANFTASEVIGKAPLTVAFNDTSVNATSRSWDFGDGTNSTEQNPVMTYAYAGNYTLKLKASNADGSDTLIVPDFITVIQPDSPVANFTAEPRCGDAPLSVTYTDTSDGDTITLWYWQFGDGTNSSEQNPVHTYSSAGNYTVSFEIANSVGTNTTTRVDYISVGNPAVTTIPTTVPTTAVTTVPTTTKPTPTTTHAPMSPFTVLGALTLIGLSIRMKRKGND